VSPDFLCKIFKIIQEDPKSELTINLEAETISIADQIEAFEIDSYKKICLINGYDDIDFLINQKDKIQEFESKIAY
jgi:3-isopropylmalate/(R)-2-methylmalate dehydratase small subunit